MRSKPLPVNLSRVAQADLWQIYDFNLQRYGQKRADSYEAFIADGIKKLGTAYPRSKTVERNPDLHYWVLQRRSKRDGHVVVFSISDAINVLHVFHTKQDWHRKL